MKNNYFTKITNIFKSRLEIERNLATQHFYDHFHPDSISADIVDLILSYYKSGFKIEKSHSKYIGKQILLPDSLEPTKQDPFEYIWLTIIINKDEILENNQHLTEKDIQDTLNLILKDMIDSRYKKQLSSTTDKLLKDFSYFYDCMHLLEYDSTDIIKNFFFNIDLMAEYFDTFNTLKSPPNILLLNKTIGTILFIDFPEPQIQKFKQIQEDLKNITLSSEKDTLEKEENKKQQIEKNSKQYFDINKLSLLYSQPSKDIAFEIKDNLQALNSFKKSLLSLTDKEDRIKLLCTNIFNNLETILNFPKLHNYKEQQRYINNLLTQHLPDIFNNYFELPENFRTNSNNKNNPQEVFEEILLDVDNKILKVSEDIFQDNLTNLNIKKRFIKSI